MLCLDQDFTSFHAICAGHPILGFVDQAKCGGMLRSPTAFEDLVKTVCTTNCDWRNTKKMCDYLCRLDAGGFPTAEVLWGYSEKQLMAEVPLGYRAGTVRTVAGLHVAGQLPLDQWAAAGDWGRIRDSLSGVRGIGSYTVAHMLVLLGHYSTIPVDSEVMKYLQNTHFGGKKVSEREAISPYAPYGDHSFLAYKFGRMGRRLNYVDK
jgi:3-methyladenine DNA glycosylase/8-oxoguanine DNA glycosylase